MLAFYLGDIETCTFRGRCTVEHNEFGVVACIPSSFVWQFVRSMYRVVFASVLLLNLSVRQTTPFFPARGFALWDSSLLGAEPSG